MFQSTTIIAKQDESNVRNISINNSLRPGGLQFRRPKVFGKLKYDCRKPWHFRIIELSTTCDWPLFHQLGIPGKMSCLVKTTEVETIFKKVRRKIPKCSGTPTSDTLILREHTIFNRLGFVKFPWTRYLIPSKPLVHSSTFSALILKPAPGEFFWASKRGAGGRYFMSYSSQRYPVGPCVQSCAFYLMCTRALQWPRQPYY